MPSSLLHVFALTASERLSLPFFLSRVPAGFPSPAEDYVEGRIDLNRLLVTKPAATFMVQVIGDSMIGDGIHEGDRLVVVKGKKANIGSVVIAVLNGELMVKRFGKRDGRPILESSNPKYPTVEIQDGAELQIWGVVDYVIHPL
jgi:DNA polymerase V